MAYSSSSSMQDLFYMDNAPVASTSTCSTPETRFTVDYAPRPSPIHHWLAAHRPYLPHDEPASCSTPRSAFSDDEDESEESEQEQDESEDESEEEDEREMIFLRPRRHGSASPFARSSSDLVSPRKLRSNPVLPTTVAAAAAPAKKAKQSNSPRMIAALASYRPRPAQPIVDRVQASGTSSFEAAPCTSHWSSDEDECSEDYERRPRGRPYRRSTLRPDQDDEALWTVAPNELALEDDDEEDDEEEMPGLCEGSSTRSLPIPISPSPLRHPYFDPSRDDVSIVLSTTEQQPISPAHDAKATRQLFQKGQSFYNGWLREYVAAHH